MTLDMTCKHMLQHCRNLNADTQAHACIPLLLQAAGSLSYRQIEWICMLMQLFERLHDHHMRLGQQQTAETELHDFVSTCLFQTSFLGRMGSILPKQCQNLCDGGSMIFGICRDERVQKAQHWCSKWDRKGVHGQSERVKAGTFGVRLMSPRAAGACWK